MFNKIQQFFDAFLNENSQDKIPLDQQLQLACAALLVEITHADEKVTGEEETALHQILRKRFGLDDKQQTRLLSLAKEKKQKATDYYTFTSLINEHYDQQQKIRLVKDLWQVAYADDELDKYEEHLIRRLAELLHVPHHEFIRTKHQVIE
jgi:uncharacterized tellurite resistance protein B-like protein